MSIVGNKEDAEDIIQETFFKVYRNIKSFYNLEREDLIALLVIYMKNTAKDHLRKQKRRLKTVSQTYEDENGEEQEYIIPDNADAPDEVLIKREHSRQLAECIDLLPEGQRHALLLKYKYGYKESDIAKVLMISETAVSSRINRAKETLRKMIGGDRNE